MVTIKSMVVVFLHAMILTYTKIAELPVFTGGLVIMSAVICLALIFADWRADHRN